MLWTAVQVVLLWTEYGSGTEIWLRRGWSWKADAQCEFGCLTEFILGCKLSLIPLKWKTKDLTVTLSRLLFKVKLCTWYVWRTRIHWLWWLSPTFNISIEQKFVTSLLDLVKDSQAKISMEPWQFTGGRTGEIQPLRRKRATDKQQKGSLLPLLISVCSFKLLYLTWNRTCFSHIKYSL